MDEPTTPRAVMQMCEARHRCHRCGYNARVRHLGGDEYMLFKHSRQTGCPNVMIVKEDERL